jgi:hypothetical protein
MGPPGGQCLSNQGRQMSTSLHGYPRLGALGMIRRLALIGSALARKAE